MRIVVAGDKETSTDELRHWLLENNLCSDVRFLSLDTVADRAAELRPRGVILCLPEKPERALPLIRDIQETLQARILVIGPTAEAKLILRILKEGAFRYIDQDDFKTELVATLQNFHEDSPSDRQLGRLITVIGAGGGNGVSTLAANVAAGLAQTHGQVGLLDLHVTSGDLASLLDLQPVHTLADFCRNVGRMDREMFSRCLTKHVTGVHLLAAPNSYHESSAITSRGVRKALGMARSRFDYVVADVDATFQPEQAPALVQADIVLLVMRLDYASVRQSQQLLDYFDELELERQRIHITVSRYGRPKELRWGQVKQVLEAEARYFVPDDTARINRAANRGNLVILDSPRSTVSRRFMEISHCVNGKS
jgi:pilus assembly protein CpaE